MPQTFEEVLVEVKAFIAMGGGGSYWFSKAYASWYWGTEYWKISLGGYENLDENNKRLFAKMLCLRKYPGRTNSALHDVAMFAVEEWDLLPRESR
jgi:hypothetical protein